MSDSVSPPVLSESHRQMLEVESAIDPNIIAARGYRTVTTQEARQYGFEGEQARAGLLIPVHTTDGKIAGYVLRPDNPRIRVSKRGSKDPMTGDRKQEVIKYEWPAKKEPRVDCPPTCFPQLKDPTVPLWITEGQKKGDALASWRQCVIDFPNGVWGWKSKQLGILADLDYIVWTDRQVYIVFDSDVITKPAVAKALSRLMTVLSRRGAKVSPVPLPQGNEKLGIDDFKAKGGTLEELMAFVALGKSLPLKTDGRLPTEAESAEYLEALARLGYRFHMNAIDDTIEVNGLPITDPLRALIRTRMRDAGYKKVSEIEDAYIAWAYYKNQYHPVKNWLNGLKWDGGAHIAALASYFRDDHEEVFKEFYPGDTYTYNGYYVFYCWLHRWLIGAVAKVLDARQNVMLVLDGPQGCGKSHFVSWLGSVLPEFFIEAPINPDDKDSWLRLISKFVWEVGEFGASFRRSDREALKNFITTRIVTLRKAYGKYDTIKPAMASLIGTINNEAGFLTDPTGNRRFLICRLVGINWQYITEVDPCQVWAEAVALYRQQEPWTLTSEEAEMHDRINEGYTLENPLEEMLWQHFVYNAVLEIWTPAMQIVTQLELLGLRGHQGQHLKDLSIAMKKVGAKKGRPSLPGRPVCYKGVYKK